MEGGIDDKLKFPIARRHENVNRLDPISSAIILLEHKGYSMKSSSYFSNLFTVLLLLSAPFALQGSPKTYQVTGPVLELNDTIIVVQKGDERWEITRESSTKVEGDLAVGKKVTVKYRMVATSVEVKSEKAKKTKDQPLQ